MVTLNKIIKLKNLAEKLSQHKKEGSKIVMCHGVFDLLHLGHIRHFEQAKTHGDLLVVTITPDRFVNKGTHRPVFPEGQRAETIAALGVVDYVAVNDWPTGSEVIEILRPDVFCKGGEFRHMEKELPAGLQSEVDAVVRVGGRVEFTDDNLSSSSNLINSFVNIFPPKTEEWLRDFRQHHVVNEITDYLERATRLKVLVVGEAIIDEYVFCDGLGKSSKDPILAFLYRLTETYSGGSLAVANHLAGFCDEVGLVTLLGEKERREKFVRNALHANIQPFFVTRPGAPTICKRRFVDSHTTARMFELYVMDDDPLPAESEEALLRTLERTIAEYDVVVVTDYGHGMMTQAVIHELCDSARFLTVNTQANAGNRGFNTISRYPRADYVCLAMHEVALETRMRYASWYDLVLEVTKHIECPHFTVTWGRNGILHYSLNCDFTEVPALATRVQDRLGSGDAVLALTSLLVAQDVPWDIVGFVGNLAGAQIVAELGNRVAINKDSMVRHITSMMK